MEIGFSPSLCFFYLLSSVNWDLSGFQKPLFSLRDYSQILFYVHSFVFWPVLTENKARQYCFWKAGRKNTDWNVSTQVAHVSNSYSRKQSWYGCSINLLWVHASHLHDVLQPILKLRSDIQMMRIEMQLLYFVMSNHKMAYTFLTKFNCGFWSDCH